MKYCSECGKKIKNTNQKTRTHNKKNNFLKASGILTSNAAALCFIIGIIGLLAFSSGSWYNFQQPFYDYGEAPYHYNVPMPQYVLTAAFGFFAFAFGLVSGILILIRRLYSLTLLGQIFMIIAAIMLLSVEFWFFILFGVPILVLTILGIVFASFSQNEFIT
jgi:hypothetical protein